MAKSKEQKKSNAETVATSQRVGYMSKDEYDMFSDLAKKARLKFYETKMGDVLMVKFGDVKFYTETF